MNRLNFQIYDECQCSHVHRDYSQILIPIKDTLDICIKDLSYNVSSQDLCFIPVGMLHECKFFGELLAINIPKGMIGRKNEEILSDRPVMSMHGQMTQFVGFIRSEFKQNPESKALYHLYNYLCDKLLENISLASVRFIRQNYDQPVTIKQLAELENYSVTYFNYWFKLQTGLTPHRFLQCVRICKAKELLEATDFSVMQIAPMVGYSSNATLTRAFRDVTGTVPEDYRIKRGRSCREA